MKFKILFRVLYRLVSRHGQGGSVMLFRVTFAIEVRKFLKRVGYDNFLTDSASSADLPPVA